MTLLGIVLIIMSSSAYAENAVPSRAYRVYSFEKAGLVQETASSDELSKDMLFIKAKKLTLAELVKQYPHIPEAKLKRLQQVTRGEK